MRDNYWLEER